MADYQDLDDYGTSRSGFSLSAPKDRGPEHRPGSKDVPMPAPQSQPATLRPGSPHESLPPRPPAAPAGLAARDALVSSTPMFQRTFSFSGDSCAAAGEAVLPPHLAEPMSPL